MNSIAGSVLASFRKFESIRESAQDVHLPLQPKNAMIAEVPTK
jgi:hypothetical protein